jgi:hypothetical protein
MIAHQTCRSHKHAAPAFARIEIAELRLAGGERKTLAAGIMDATPLGP